MGWQYNQRISEFLEVQLGKAGPIRPPKDASGNDVDTFNKQLAKGRRLLEKHAQLFDIRDFYTTNDAQQGVQQICEVLRDTIEHWRMHEEVSIDVMIPEEWLDEDRRLLWRLLNYVLRGVEVEMDEHVRHSWNDAKAKLKDRLKRVKVVEREEIIVGERLAQGGKGVVFKATLGGRDVAVKRPMWEDDLPLEDLALFVREVSLHAAVNRHPNIVELLATTACGWLVMELAVSDLHTFCQKKLAYGVKLHLLQQAAEGLICLHALNLVHGDVKSRNCLIFGQDPEHPVLKLSDLGLTFEVGESRSKTIRRGGGTPAWIAPEVYDGRPIDKASDVYSFGVLMYELVSGKEPYGAGGNTTEYEIMALKLVGKEPCRVQPKDCPKAMYDLMRRCCMRDASKRPTMEEVGQILLQMPTDEVPWEPEVADVTWARTASDILLTLDNIACLPPFPSTDELLDSSGRQHDTYQQHAYMGHLSTAAGEQSNNAMDERFRGNAAHRQGFLDPLSRQSIATGRSSDGTSGSRASDPAAPSVHRALPDGDRGLVISGALLRVDGQVVYNLQVGNETEVLVDGLTIEMAANSFGLQPADEVSMIPSVAPHSIYTAVMPLLCQPNAVSEGPASNVLNIVAKTRWPTSVLCFQEEVPVEVLFSAGGDMGEENFCQEWDRLGEERQKTQAIEAMVFDLHSALQGLRDVNVAIVACSQIERSDRKEIRSRCLLDSMSAQVLLQLRFLHGESGVDCTCRSERPDLAPLVFSAVQRILSRIEQPGPDTDSNVHSEDGIEQEVSVSRELSLHLSPAVPSTPDARVSERSFTDTTGSMLSTDASRQFSHLSIPTLCCGDGMASTCSASPRRSSNALPSPSYSSSLSLGPSPFQASRSSAAALEAPASRVSQQSVDTRDVDDATKSSTKTSSTKVQLSFVRRLLFPLIPEPGRTVSRTMVERETESQRELQEAAKAGLVKRVIALLDHGVNVDAKGAWFAGTALRLAAVHGHVQVAEVLLSKGTNINAKDRDGNTALHFAARDGKMEMVQCLLQQGANKQIRNDNGILFGDTAADVARGEGHAEIAKFIKGWGKRWSIRVYPPVAVFRTSQQT